MPREKRNGKRKAHDAQRIASSVPVLLCSYTFHRDLDTEVHSLDVADKVLHSTLWLLHIHFLLSTLRPSTHIPLLIETVPPSPVSVKCSTIITLR